MQVQQVDYQGASVNAGAPILTSDDLEDLVRHWNDLDILVAIIRAVDPDSLAVAFDLLTSPN
jgi:hypothetical protein